jgi:hypothetical protein
LDGRLPARLDRVHTRRQVFTGLHCDMKLKFVIEFVLNLLTRYYGAEAQPQVM